MKKVYLAGGISDTARKTFQKTLANTIRNAGDYDVYAAAENDSINDKTNNPTPLDIYNADISKLRECDIFVQTISGAGEDGTNYESGVVAGINEERYRFKQVLNNVMLAILTGEDIDEILNTIIDELFEYYAEPIKIIAFTTNERILNPQFFSGDKEDIIGIPSGSYNHLILGGIDRWGLFAGILEDLIKVLDNEYEM